MTKVTLVAKTVDGLQIELAVDTEGAKEALEQADTLIRPVQVTITRAEAE